MDLRFSLKVNSGNKFRGARLGLSWSRVVGDPRSTLVWVVIASDTYPIRYRIVKIKVSFIFRYIRSIEKSDTFRRREN